MRAIDTLASFALLAGGTYFIVRGLALAQRRLRWEIAPYMAVPTYLAAAVAIAGEEAIDRAAAAWRSGGRAAAGPAVPQELIDSLLVHGDATGFAKRLADFRAAGVDAVRLVPLTSLGGSIDDAHAVIDVLGELSSLGSCPVRPAGSARSPCAPAMRGPGRR